jgi:hypothetical protein
MNRRIFFAGVFLTGFVLVSTLPAQVFWLSDLAVYEPYGLVFDQTHGAYRFNDKLVGLFIDLQGRGITFLNTGGDIHIKVLRDNTGGINGLTELTAAEYDAIIADMSARQEALEKQMEKLRENMRNLQPPAPPQPPRIGVR